MPAAQRLEGREEPPLHVVVNEVLLITELLHEDEVVGLPVQFTLVQTETYMSTFSAICKRRVSFQWLYSHYRRRNVKKTQPL